MDRLAAQTWPLLLINEGTIPDGTYTLPSVRVRRLTRQEIISAVNGPPPSNVEMWGT